MKRDLDLIRNILLAIEADDSGKLSVYKIAEIVNSSPDTVWYHLELLRDQHFILMRGGVVAFTPNKRKYEPFSVKRMTFSGCDYLESIKNDTVWNKVKDNLKQFGGSAPFDVIKSLANKICLDVIENQISH